MFRKYSKVSKVESCLLRHTNSHMYQPYRHIKFVFGLLFCILKRSRDFLLCTSCQYKLSEKLVRSGHYRGTIDIAS